MEMTIMKIMRMTYDCAAFDRDSHFSEYCDAIMKALQSICKSLVYK